MPSLNTKLVQNLPVIINPDGREQEKVSSCLDSLHQLIGSQKKAYTNISKVLNCLFRSWFIDFNPVIASRWKDTIWDG